MLPKKTIEQNQNCQKEILRLMEETSRINNQNHFLIAALSSFFTLATLILLKSILNG